MEFNSIFNRHLPGFNDMGGCIILVVITADETVWGMFWVEVGCENTLMFLRCCGWPITEGALLSVVLIADPWFLARSKGTIFPASPFSSSAFPLMFFWNTYHRKASVQLIYNHSVEWRSKSGELLSLWWRWNLRVHPFLGQIKSCSGLFSFYTTQNTKLWENFEN